ncbi:MAG: hypothetical protein IJY40_05520 [Oscillospiraceae bacterium]|nr:hypothetical protein [Oscillospiraceae bacterium]
MARKKIEFRPDPTGHNWADKLRLTPLQRKSVLKWMLYSTVCVAGLVLQDSMLARLRLFGGCFDVTPALIVLICVLEGSENGSLFALLASMVYVFSGTGQGHYCIAMLTLAAVLATAFRQSYLRRGAGSDLICVGGAMVLYEMAVFTAGVLQGLTYRARWGVFLMTAVVSTLTAGAVYALLKYIGTIGGNAWKE